MKTDLVAMIEGPLVSIVIGSPATLRVKANASVMSSGTVRQIRRVGNPRLDWAVAEPAQDG